MHQAITMNDNGSVLKMDSQPTPYIQSSGTSMLNILGMINHKKSNLVPRMHWQGL